MSIRVAGLVSNLPGEPDKVDALEIMPLAAAMMIGCHVATVYRMAHQGVLKSRLDGHRKRLRLDYELVKSFCASHGEVA